VQNRKTRVTASTILLNGTWDSELKPERDSNPKGFVVTNNWKDIILNPPVELVEQFVKDIKLIYNKDMVNFNVGSGKYLYFAEDGACYILKKMNEVQG
jgi:hypothetical protein